MAENTMPSCFMLHSPSDTPPALSRRQGRIDRTNVLRNSKLSTLSGSKSGFNDSPDEVYGLAIVKTPMSARVKYPYIRRLSYGRRHLLMWRRNTCPLEVGI
jgi:hypothetical protein